MSVEVRVPHGVDVRVRHVDARDTVTPSEGQYRILRLIADGSALVYGSRSECEPLIRREWVTYVTSGPRGYGGVRITPGGIRAYALAVEKFGLPENPRLKSAADKRREPLDVRTSSPALSRGMTERRHP